MPRKLRAESQTGIYHVMLRGVNKQRIFEHIEDYDAFLRILRYTMDTDTLLNPVKEPTYDLYAYCLMDNHVHLLIAPCLYNISKTISRIASSYAQVFNLRYNRVGHLFQDRFKSTPCEDEQYFFYLLTYIHMNPVKGGLCLSPSRYTYCSFNDILRKTTQKGQTLLCSFEERIAGVNKKSIQKWLVNMTHDEYVHRSQELGKNVATKYKQELSGLKQLAQDKQIAIEQITDSEKRTTISNSPLEQFADKCRNLLGFLHIEATQKIDADELDKLIVECLLTLSQTRSITEFQQLDKKSMRGTLARVRDAGISLRHLSRISGISEGIIRYSKNPDNLL